MKTQKLFAVLSTCIGALVAAQLAYAEGAPELSNRPADSPAGPWMCAMGFEAEGGGVQLIAGYFMLGGNGELDCVNLQGQTETFPVRVTLGASPIEPMIGVGLFHVSGVATGIGIVGSPQDLTGDYIALDARGAVIVGAGGNVSFGARNGAMTLDLSLQLTEGWGFDLGLENLHVEVAH